MFLEAAGRHSGYRPDEEIGRARASGIRRWLIPAAEAEFAEGELLEFHPAAEAEAKRMLAIAKAANTQTIVTPRTDICIIGPTF